MSQCVSKATHFPPYSLQVVKPTKRVVLNCAEIDISSVRCGGQEGTVTFCKEEETVVLEFPSDVGLEGGEGVITVEYTGILNDQMRGFYRAKYSGVERYAAVTQFEVCVCVCACACACANAACVCVIWVCVCFECHACAYIGNCDCKNQLIYSTHYALHPCYLV